MLTQEQKYLCHRLYKSVRKKENIDEIVREVTGDDFLKIFKAINRESKETLLGSVESVLPEQIKAVLNRAKELNLLEETLKAEILSSKDGDEVRHISLIEYITGYNGNLSPEFRGVIGEFYKLGLKNEKSMVTEESIQIDNTGDKEDLPETSSLASDESTINSKSNPATDTVPQSNPIKHRGAI
ncbi:hypothetical protein NOX90_03185 [Wolbachia endosymbiont of Anurida maritima]|uniref:hypothetical protein n=1 Tax=Wolbachia endosymbiont of Anurida maritima TaxID=2850562 RepID=UPI0035CF5D4F